MKTTEQMVAAAKAAGICLTVSTPKTGTGEIALLPGVRPKPKPDPRYPE